MGRDASHHGRRHFGGSHHGEKPEIRVDMNSFKEMKKSDMWAKIEEVEKLVDSYRDRHQRGVDKVREEKKRWLEDWEERQRDEKKLFAMNTKVRQLKQIANGGHHSDDVHLESKSGIRINEEHFKAMSKSNQWAKIEEAQAQVDAFKIEHYKNLESSTKGKKRWLEESEKLKHHLKELSDMRSDLRHLKQFAHR